jgi:hypothetical protein
MRKRAPAARAKNPAIVSIAAPLTKDCLVKITPHTVSTLQSHFIIAHQGKITTEINFPLIFSVFQESSGLCAAALYEKKKDA